MSNGDFEQRKKAIKDQLRRYLAGRTEIGLSDVKRNLSNAFAGTPSAPLVEQGLFVAKMLNAVGWQRDGWLYTGYDRTPRYVCAIASKLRAHETWLRELEGTRPAANCPPERNRPS